MPASNCGTCRLCVCCAASTPGHRQQQARYGCLCSPCGSSCWPVEMLTAAWRACALREKQLLMWSPLVCPSPPPNMGSADCQLVRVFHTLCFDFVFV
jgi:hypothetical protein